MSIVNGTFASEAFVVRRVAIVAVGAAWAALLAVLLVSGNRLYAIPLIVSTVFPVILYASRNPRLVFLVGAVFSAPLGLSINFDSLTHIGGATSYSIDLVDFFILPLAVFLVRDFARGYRKSFVVSWVPAWWLGLTALGLWSVIAGPYRQLPAFEVLRMVKLILLFLVVTNECVRERRFEYVLYALAASVALNVVIAAIQFAVKHDLGLQALGEPSAEATLGASYGVFLRAGAVYRVGALIAHPNLFGAWLALLLPILVAMLFTPLAGGTRLALAAVSVGGVAALILTLSRTAWAGFALAMMFLCAVLLLHPAVRRRYLVLKVALVGTLLAGSVAAAGPILLRLTASDPGALDFRREWLAIAWRMVEARPLLGFGLNTFTYQLPGYAPYSVSKLIDLFGTTWPVVHNVYMLVWAEQGTVGLLLFLGFLAQIFWIGWRNFRFRASEKIFMLNAGALCGLSAILVDGLGSFFIRVPACGRTYWVVVSVVVAANYWNRRNEPLRGGSPPERGASPR